MVLPRFRKLAELDPCANILNIIGKDRLFLNLLSYSVLIM